MWQGGFAGCGRRHGRGDAGSAAAAVAGPASCAASAFCGRVCGQAAGCVRHRGRRCACADSTLPMCRPFAHRIVSCSSHLRVLLRNSCAGHLETLSTSLHNFLAEACLLASIDDPALGEARCTRQFCSSGQQRRSVHQWLCVCSWTSLTAALPAYLAASSRGAQPSATQLPLQTHVMIAITRRLQARSVPQTPRRGSAPRRLRARLTL